MPALDTVAGLATDRFSTSNNNPTYYGNDILSPFNKVSTLLSSKTVFIDSIHRVSTGPSKTIQRKSVDSSLQSLAIIDDKTPSLHSIVAKSILPNKSFMVIDLGFKTSCLTNGCSDGFYLWSEFKADFKTFQQVDLPDNVLPTNILPWRVIIES